LLKDLKSLKNVYLWYVAVESAKMAVVLGSSGSEGLAGPGNTGEIVPNTKYLSE
jgi:hypothetical protein